MKLQICSFNVCKQLKEIGFNLETKYEWLYNSKGHTDDDESGIHPTNRDYGNMGLNTIIKMPEQALVQMWLREKYDLHINIHHTCDKNVWAYYIDNWERDYENESTFPSYEQALEAGILESIKLIKTKQDENN